MLRLYHDARVAWLRSDGATAEAKLQQYFAEGEQPGGEAAYELLETLLTQRLGEVAGRRELHKRLNGLLASQPANDTLALYAAQASLADGDAKQATLLLEPLIASAADGEPFRLMLGAAIDLRDAAAIPVLVGQALDRLGSLRPLEVEIERLCQDAPLLDRVLLEAETRRADKRRPMLAREAVASGLVCLAAQRLEQADRFAAFAFSTADAGQPRDPLKRLWAEECYLADDFPAAIRWLRELVAGADEDAPVAAWHDMLAAALQLDGQIDAALEVIDRALEAEPDSAALQLRRALILAHAKRWDEASDAYQAIVTMFGEDYDSEVNREVVKIAKTYLSALLVERGSVDRAIELLQQVLDEYPADVAAGNDLGYLWADQNVHLQLALRMTQAAVAAEPDNVAYLDSLAWVYFRLGRPAESLPLLVKATRQEEQDAVILDHLGDVYAALQDQPKAVDAWMRAASVAEARDDAEQAEAIRHKAHGGFPAVSLPEGAQQIPGRDAE